MCKDIQAAAETHCAIESELLKITQSLTEISFILASSPICENKRKGYLTIIQDYVTLLRGTATAMNSYYSFFFEGFDTKKDKERMDLIDRLAKEGIEKVELTKSLNIARRLFSNLPNKEHESN